MQGRALMDRASSFKGRTVVFALLSFVVGGSLGITLASYRHRSPSILTPKYGYPFKIVPTEDLRAEIRFYEERTRERPSAADLLLLAELYVNEAKKNEDPALFQQAKDTLGRVLILAPGANLRAWALRAEILETEHRFREAIAIGDQMLEKSVGSTDAWKTKVSCHLALGEIDAADAAAERLVALAPNLTAHTLRALVMVARGRDREAIFDFNRALELELGGSLPASTWSRALYARYLIDQGRWRDADRLLEVAERLTPSHPLVLRLKGDLAFRQRQYRLAVGRYQQGFDTTKDPVFMVQYAIALQASGDRSASRDIFLRAEALIRAEQEKKPFAHPLELASLLLERADPADLLEALTILRRESAVRQDMETLYLLSKSLVLSKQYGQAKLIIDRWLATGIRQARAYELAATVEEAMANPLRAQFFAQEAARLSRCSR